MRKIYLLLVLVICSTTLWAQKNESASLRNQKKEIDGYTIQIKPAPLETFLFDILKDGRPVYTLMNNPFTMKPEGFEKRNDAFNIGEWLIREFKMTQHFPPIVPPHVADLYKIKINSETRPNQN
jgi:hypothetical protein